MLNHYKRKLFDRADGWRVKNVDAMFAVIPFIMRTRLDSQNSIDDQLDMDKLSSFIRAHKEDCPNLSTMHIIMAALVRTISQRPSLNRFVVYNKIYARNTITISLMIKRTLSDEGEETLAKMEFDPTDTLYDVARKVDKAIEDTKPTGEVNATDKIARWFGLIPAWLVRFLIGTLRWLDNWGILPTFIQKASPFHCSVFVTNLASVRCGAIYHHLYEFGTCSAFCSIGKPEHAAVADGKEVKSKRVLPFKIVTDERVADGYYYAATLRLMHQYLNNPELLLTPPEKVVADNGVGRPRIDQ